MNLFAQKQEELRLPPAPDNMPPRYNVSPTTQIDIIVRGKDGKPQLIKARWGLIPPWHKGAVKDFKLATFNARIEGVDTSGTFKNAWKSRRCVIPASGFFEWTAGDGKQRIPHFISAADGGILGFAGLWERWKSPEGEEILSATIIVQEAGRFMSKLHNRQPAMLHPDDFSAWLDGTGGKELFAKPPPELREWIVAQTVNKAGAGNDDPDTIKPVER